mmetsp:Transcript_30582/g.29492  ORF Transcript_30582/g.29492 Transcript_30582/m.29492 type:complete len:85 (-) Transcript_30582:55-309(-)
MGSMCSKKRSLNTVDDSVHRRLKHDRKRMKAKHIKLASYCPRPQHPSFVQAENYQEQLRHEQQQVLGLPEKSVDGLHKKATEDT